MVFLNVSMESGLEDRNNRGPGTPVCVPGATVSMESGLEDRNNVAALQLYRHTLVVSMESGLEDRNNVMTSGIIGAASQGVSMESGLEDRNNQHVDTALARYLGVSMESGLEDRNNQPFSQMGVSTPSSLNGVRPRRPEQSRSERPQIHTTHVSMESGLEDRNNAVRPARAQRGVRVSMESGLEDRNNHHSCRSGGRKGDRLNGVRPRRPEQFFL